MKKLLAILLSVLFVFSTLPVSAATDYDEFEFTYVIEDGEATITGATGIFPSHLAIPSHIGTYPVTGIGRVDDGYSAFGGNNAIYSLSIPNTVKEIGYCAFCNCSNLSSVTLSEGLEMIGACAFEGCNLSSVVIPESIKLIGGSAFEDCEKLAEISLPDIPIDIREDAFLNTAYYNDENNWEDEVLYIGKTLIKANSSFANEYTIKDGTVCIAHSAFSPSCDSLEKIAMPDSLKYIGPAAFYDCDNLRNVTIPDSVTYIGQYAFANCNYLYTVKIGNGVKKIDHYAFHFSTRLSTLYLGSGVETIGVNAFLKKHNTQTSTTIFGVTNLYITDLEAYCKLRITYDVSVNKPVPPLGLTENIYLNGELLTDLVIPEGITKIYDHAFRDCSSITSVTFPESVESIGYDAFFNCDNLKSVNIPNGIIGVSAFGGCSYLDNVTLGKGVTSIDDYAFTGCGYLTAITIPESVTSIGANSFYGCTLEPFDDPFAGMIGGESRDALVIYTNKNSTAHTYSKEKGIYNAILGDFTEDENIKAEDMSALKKVLLQGGGKPNADLNCDGKINLLDLVSMKKVLAN